MIRCTETVIINISIRYQAHKRFVIIHDLVKHIHAHNLMCVHTCTKSTKTTYVTGPEKTGLIYIKYTYSYYDTYLLFCMSY